MEDKTIERSADNSRAIDPTSPLASATVPGERSTHAEVQHYIAHLSALGATDDEIHADLIALAFSEASAAHQVAMFHQAQS